MIDTPRNSLKELENLAQLMRNQNLDAVFAEYGGFGNSGTVNNVSLYQESEKKTWKNVANEVLEVVHDAVCALLEQNHSRWKVDNGSNGNIEFWKNENGSVTVSWHHRQFYLASDDTEHEFQID